MATALIMLVWLLNLGISFWNAYASGLAWVEAKHQGGWPRVMAWSGAIMSACGFSWCYLLILACAAYGLEWITYDHVQIALSIGYILIIPAILASGMTIMLDSWARVYRVRMVRNIGSAAWNTYAQIHNTFGAVTTLDNAFGMVMSSFDSEDSDSKNSNSSLIVVFILVILALLSGYFTTAAIINRVAGNDPLPDHDESKPS